VPNIGPLELAIVLLIVLVIFGPKRLPGLGRSLGRGMREFKDGITGKDSGGEEDDQPELSRATAVAPVEHGTSPRTEDEVPAEPRS